MKDELERAQGVAAHRSAFSLHPSAFLFDAVGTLIHPEPSVAEAYAAAGRRHGSRLSLDEIERGFRAAFVAEEARDAAERDLRTSEDRELARWRGIVGTTLTDVAADACEPLFRELWDHFARPTSWRAFDDAEPTLLALAERGHTIAIASNFDARLYAIVAALLPIVPRERVFVSSELGVRKPARDFFAHCRKRLNVAADRATIVVGDDVDNDFHGARACGLEAILLDRRGRHGAIAPRISALAELLP